jgi:hypothetical protein
LASELAGCNERLVTWIGAADDIRQQGVGSKLQVEDVKAIHESRRKVEKCAASVEADLGEWIELVMHEGDTWMTSRERYPIGMLPLKRSSDIIKRIVLLADELKILVNSFYIVFPLLPTYPGSTPIESSMLVSPKFNPSFWSNQLSTENRTYKYSPLTLRSLSSPNNIQIPSPTGETA